ncbi:GNAT family N-acetyltransferase [Bacillus sp. JJ1609]|uniref:GNAT family N-acetyltransferase n=1 Tax=Bacillus sp. JJ1609 TaxID=3122977 RepID=UPI0030004405
MDFDYERFNSIPEDDILEGICKLHREIFGQSDHLITQMKRKSQLLFNLSLNGRKVIGYKIGYPLDEEKFYSWIGGVDPAYRTQGIASMLMEKQHTHLRANGFKVVQTKTKNKWRSMLILNIKNGFNIIGTYTDDEGEPKIILEKRLTN